MAKKTPDKAIEINSLVGGIITQISWDFPCHIPSSGGEKISFSNNNKKKKEEEWMNERKRQAEL